MRVTVNENMKTWVAEYIRAHRKDGSISIHVVYSKFNEDFKRTFGIDPVAAVQLLIAENFLKGSQARGGFSIWLPEDSGKGHARPFHPRASASAVAQTEPKTVPVTPAQKTGESEMSEETAIVPHYEFEKIPLPDTGEIDVLKLIRHIMTHVAARLPSNPEMDGGYAIGNVKLTDTMQACGVPRGSCPALSRIMQGMGLIRRYDRFKWGVLHTKAADYFITIRAYEIAKKAMIKRQSVNNEVTRLRQKLEATLNSGPRENDASGAPVSTSLDETTLEVLAEAEALAEDLQKARERITELEAERDKLLDELKNRPAVEDAAKQVILDRLAALKKART